MALYCSTHNKPRTAANLIENPPGSGTYTCRQGGECRPGGTGGRVAGGQAPPTVAPGPDAPKEDVVTTQMLAAQGHTIIHPTQPEVCHAHQKTRSASQLYQVMTPNGVQWECIPEARCKVPLPGGGPANSMGAVARFNPYPTPGKKPGEWDHALMAMMHTPDPEFCMVHQKKRSPSSLVVGPHGQYQCRPDSECKVKGTVSTSGLCVVHNKSRKQDYLEPDGSGGFRCIAGYNCQ